MSVGAGSIKRAAKAAGKAEEVKTAAVTVKPEEVKVAGKPEEGKKTAAPVKSAAKAKAKPVSRKTADTRAKKTDTKQPDTKKPDTKQERRYGVGEELPIYLM